MTKDRLLAYAQLMGACDKNGLDVIANSKGVQDWINLLISPQGVEFCMENQFPAIPVLMEYKKELADRSVFLDDDYKVTNSRIVVVFGGHVTVQVNNYDVCAVYATNDAQVVINACDNAYVTVELHHQATCITDILDNAKVKIYQK